MIVIHIRLAAISLAAIGLAMFMAAIAVLGLILGIQIYHEYLSLRISALLTGSLAIVSTLSSLATVGWPYNPILLAVNLVLALGLGGSGVYYLAVLIDPAKYTIGTTFVRQHYHLELAFIILWVLSLLLFTSVNFYLVGLVWAAHLPISSTGTEFNIGSPYWPSPEFSDQEKFTMQKTSFPPVNLASPIDIPQVATDMPHLSPRLTWPSTINSIRPSNSLSSLRSALDGNDLPASENILPLNTDSVDLANHAAGNNPPNQKGSPAKKLFVKIMRSASTNDMGLPPPAPSSPGRSSIKLNLSRSTFSLKRERSRQMAQHPSISGLANISGYAFPHSVSPETPTDTYDATKPDIALTTSPFTVPLALSPAEGISIPESPKRWLIIPDEVSGDSRSASGSSQVTGRIFPTSDYNRKINAAGFQKDEPLLVRIENPKETLSQYDFEQAIKRKHLRKHTQSQ